MKEERYSQAHSTGEFMEVSRFFFSHPAFKKPSQHQSPDSLIPLLMGSSEGYFKTIRAKDAIVGQSNGSFHQIFHSNRLEPGMF